MITNNEPRTGQRRLKLLCSVGPAQKRLLHIEDAMLRYDVRFQATNNFSAIRDRQKVELQKKYYSNLLNGCPPSIPSDLRLRLEVILNHLIDCSPLTGQKSG